jgi:hypothetical protein
MSQALSPFTGGVKKFRHNSHTVKPLRMHIFIGSG